MRLNLKRESEWFELLPGVRVKMKPATSPIITTARMQLREEEMVLDEAVGADAQAGRALAFAKAVAVLVIEEWDGVLGDDDQPVPVTAESVSALLDVYPVFEAFQVRYMARWLGIEAEKKDSAPLQSGGSAGATDTAKPAHPSAPTVLNG